MIKKNLPRRIAWAFWALLFIFVAAGFLMEFSGTSADNTHYVSYSEIINQSQGRHIKEAVISGSVVYVELDSKKVIKSGIPANSPIADTLRSNGAEVWVKPQESSALVSLLGIFGPMLFFGALLYFTARKSGTSRIFSVGKSRARLFEESVPSTTFADVAGIDEAQGELMEIVDFLKNPTRFTAMGAQIPRGVLLSGPPGTGKTLLARAVAGEAAVPFFFTSGSDFVEMFVGIGASRIKDMFNQARKKAPCIVFIDEIDAVGRQRGAGLGGGNDEKEQTLNQLLVEMDGFSIDQGIVVIAATNRADILDSALVRPGRFDRQVTVGLPDTLAREKILAVHAKKAPLDDSVDLHEIAKATPGFSGAALASLVNEAILIAAHAFRIKVEGRDFIEARDKLTMGPERRSIIIGEKERWRTAYHEAGHAIVGMLTPGNDPIHKVSVVPRGRALGVTLSLPENDRLGWTTQELEGRLAMIYGGRAAEIIIYGEKGVSTGASNDLIQITQIARRMATEWGMAEGLGAIRYSDPEEEIFLGRTLGRTSHASEQTIARIDNAIEKIAARGEASALRVLRENHDLLEAMARLLMEKETLNQYEIVELFAHFEK